MIETLSSRPKNVEALKPEWICKGCRESVPHSTELRKSILCKRKMNFKYIYLGEGERCEGDRQESY